MTAYSKVQNVAKSIRYAGPGLEQLVLDTMKKISDIVGATLGPGGKPVLIERQEYATLPMITKDGVTVFRSLGFDNPDAQNIMESARDAAVRTASEAGDGTTTATVLAEAIVRNLSQYCKENPSISPQAVVRELQRIFREEIEPSIKNWSKSVDIATEEGKHILRSVATVSANGDKDLAEAVMKCFELVGDEGNVTLTELTGPSGYEIKRIEGYPITMGFEDTMGRYAPAFINDQGAQKCILDDCYVLTYFGRLTDAGSLAHLLNKMGQNWEFAKGKHNLIIFATGFSEQVIASFAMSFHDKMLLNIVPVQCPHFPVTDGQLGFLEDIAVVTGQRELIDPLRHRLDEVELADLGTAKLFEMGRFRSNIIGDYEKYEGEICDRVDVLKNQLVDSPGILETTYLNERIGKLTGGIAKLQIIAPSAGELRERKDRAEDAVCAVRGALKHGVLPGACWTLLKLAQAYKWCEDQPAKYLILRPAFQAPMQRIMDNMGFDPKMTADIISLYDVPACKGQVYDVVGDGWADPYEFGLLDSTPAVLEALRNSLSIATLLGTLGGVVSFKRDSDLETSEARSAQQYERDAGIQKPQRDE